MQLIIQQLQEKCGLQKSFESYEEVLKKYMKEFLQDLGISQDLLGQEKLKFFSEMQALNQAQGPEVMNQIYQLQNSFESLQSLINASLEQMVFDFQKFLNKKTGFTSLRTLLEKKIESLSGKVEKYKKQAKILKTENNSIQAQNKALAKEDGIKSVIIEDLRSIVQLNQIRFRENNLMNEIEFLQEQLACLKQQKLLLVGNL